MPTRWYQMKVKVMMWLILVLKMVLAVAAVAICCHLMTSFREGTPVQEETSQEGGERIKANGNEGNQGNRESKEEEEKVDLTIEKNLEFDQR